MIIFKEQKSYAVVEETSEEQLMSDMELRAECLSALKRMKGRVFINKSTRIPIEVNREIHDEIRIKVHVVASKRRPLARIKYLAIKVLSYFLTDSDPDELYTPDYLKRAHVEHSHIFKYKCQINGSFYLVRIRTRKVKEIENRLYFLTFEDLDLTEV
jgi:hypothetical protein